MPTVTTSDGVEIFYKDWGSGQPIVFSHGWPLSADDWDAQLLFSSAMAIASSRTRRTGSGESGDHQRGAAADGENCGEPQGPAQERFRRSSKAARRQPRQVLLRSPRWPLLRLQPTRREDDRAGGLELVAPGHDGRRQGALRRHRRLLADRLHRGSEEDQCAGAWSCTARTTRSCRMSPRRPAVSETPQARNAQDLQGPIRTACPPPMPTRSTRIFSPSSRAETDPSSRGARRPTRRSSSR